VRLVNIETNATLSPSERILDGTHVLAGVIGCLRTERDVMITGVVDPNPASAVSDIELYDWFLTWDQAAKLHAQLGAILARRPEAP
jgi:hypothetical protein